MRRTRGLAAAVALWMAFHSAPAEEASSSAAVSAAPVASTPGARPASTPPPPPSSTAPRAAVRPEPAAAVAPVPATAPATTASAVIAATPPPLRPEPVRWDYLPTVGYLGDTLWFSLRVGAGASLWQVRTNAGMVPNESGAGQQTVDCHLLLPSDATALTFIEFSAPGQRRLVHLVAPGSGATLALDRWNRLSIDGEAVVLTVDRTEPDRDRRWRPVRFSDATTPLHCPVTIQAEQTVGGDGGILSAVINAQKATVASRNTLVLVPSSDQTAGWKHREYRQVLAWLVSDLQSRHAAHVVLVDPVAPEVLRPDITPLITQVQDVADAYHCRIVALRGLSQDRYWLVSPGVLGTTLNAEGRSALDAALQAWR